MVIQCHFQICKVLNIIIVVVRMETWTSEDLYGNFSSVPLETVRLFRDYAVNYVQDSYDAVFLLT